jgi:hypothetical protein
MGLLVLIAVNAGTFACILARSTGQDPAADAEFPYPSARIAL